MDPLAVTAVTNFLLAAEAYFLAGWLMGRPAQHRSAAGWWRIAMALLATAALLGGIDHGFIEPAGQPREGIQRLTWLVMGAMTFCVVQTTAAQFLSARAAAIASWLAALQLLLYSVAMVLHDTFLVVVLNYGVVMLWFLAMNALHLRDGRGSWPMVAGTGVLFLASGLQALGVDSFSPLDRNGLYHVVSMPGVWLLFLGASRLRATRPATGR